MSAANASEENLKISQRRRRCRPAAENTRIAARPSRGGDSDPDSVSQPTITAMVTAEYRRYGVQGRTVLSRGHDSDYESDTPYGHA